MKEFFIYGILIPQKQYEGWENGTGRKFPVGIYGNLFCVFDSRDGKFVIVGRKFKRTNNDNPIIVPELSDIEKNEVEELVKESFGFEGDFHLFFVKNYE